MSITVNVFGIGQSRSKRILAALPVRLWVDAHGRPFIEISGTENVSRTGALLKGVPTKLAIGDIIGVRCQERKYQFSGGWTGKQDTISLSSSSGNGVVRMLE